MTKDRWQALNKEMATGPSRAQVVALYKQVTKKGLYRCKRNLHYFKCFLPNLSIFRKVSWTFYLFGEFINYFNLFCRFQHFYFLTSSEDKFIYVANFLCCFYLSLPRIICHNTEQVECSDLHHKKILNSRLNSLWGLHN